MKGILSCFSGSKTGSMGIGAMIIFIAMVLVAGISASVFIQTAGSIEHRSQETGMQTTDEVATGMKITDVEGQYTTRCMAYNSSSGLIWGFTNTTGTGDKAWHNYSRIQNMTMTITPNPGSSDIDLSTAILILSNCSVKCILTYDSTQFGSSVSASGVFSTSAFDLSPSDFGVIVIKDYDNSINSVAPVLNSGDRVFLTINASACFWGVPESTDMWGKIIIEEGSYASVEFRTPSTYKDTVYDFF